MPSVSSDVVESTLSAMDLDSATEPDRAGFLWLVLFANSEFCMHFDFLSLKLFTVVLKNLAVDDFSFNISHLISAASFIALDRGGANIILIAIVVVMRRLVTNALMPA